MKLLIDNSIHVLWICLNLLRWVGFFVPDELAGIKKLLFPIYFTLWFMFIVGINVICQSIALFQARGDVSEVTGIIFILFTCMAFVAKIINVNLRKQAVQTIINEVDYELKQEHGAEGKHILNSMNKETICLIILYTIDAMTTLFGWIATAINNNELLFRSWLPYDATNFPAYVLTFIHQVCVLTGVALMNVSLDHLVSLLTAGCRCRLQLVNLALRTLCRGITLTNKLLTLEEEDIVRKRLRQCVIQHQSTLESAAQIQANFSATIFGQFAVSVLIICATAYQLACETSDDSMLWRIPMASYFIGMVLQVYFYCNEAHKLTEESSLIADAVYACPWYVCSVPTRRALLIVMVRARRVTKLSAGGFATLSLTCFVSIIRASYSFFTVLKQMEE